MTQLGSPEMRSPFHGWTALNRERVELIHKEHMGGGLTEDEARRLEMLQSIAGAVAHYVAPLDVSKLEKLESSLKDAGLMVEKQTCTEPEEVAELIAWHERRIWWQEEVKRQIASPSVWETLESWRNVNIALLPVARKQAIAAAIEHEREEAGAAERQKALEQENKRIRGAIEALTEVAPNLVDKRDVLLRIRRE